jgi:hypothetical protein
VHGDNPTAAPSHHNDAGSFHGDFIVHLAFGTRDASMYRKIQEIATKERRTTEQQILYFLDGVFTRL